MDLFFQDPNEIPLPPEEVRIRAFTVEPYPDGRRVRVSLEVDPFQKRPSFDIVITDAGGEEVAQTTIIETMTRKLDVTLHLRRPPPAENQLPAEVGAPSFIAAATLFFAPQVSPEDVKLPERTVVDRAETTFELTKPEDH